MPEQEKEQKKTVSGDDLKHLVTGYIVPTLSILILVLILALVVFPSIGDIQEYNDLIDTKEKKVADLESYLSKAQALSDQESEIVSDNNLIDTYLPKQSRVASLIDSVNTLASVAGLDTNELSGSETVRKDDELVSEEEEQVDEPKRVLVTFNYEGEFEEVYKLFEQINGYRELLSVESVIFSESRDTWSVEITVASYNLEDETLDYVVQNMMKANKGRRILTIDEALLEDLKEKV